MKYKELKAENEKLKAEVAGLRSALQIALNIIEQCIKCFQRLGTSLKVD